MVVATRVDPGRYQGRDIYKVIGQKVFLSGFDKVTKDEAEADELKEKFDGKE